jgi:hypothetical protein
VTGCGSGGSAFSGVAASGGEVVSAGPGAGGSSGSLTSGSGNNGGTDLITTSSTGSGGPCTGLECSIPKDCGTKDGTTITGLAYAPNGTLPLYNVVVYIPRYPEKPLEPFTFGAKCEQCASKIDNVVVTALTDSKGSFKITNAPAGKNIPLVVQIGKWRRKVVLPNVEACKENKLTDANLTRLPRHKGEGDLPQMALVTGGADPLGCLFPKLGLAPQEFTDSSQKGKMHIYKGIGGGGVDGGAAKLPEQSLWNAQ